MAKEFAVLRKNGEETEYLYCSDGFSLNPENTVIRLSEDTELRICEAEVSDEVRELRIRLKEAEEANLAKESFLSNMSHDIRTPMNAIIGMTAIAQKHIDEKSRVADSLDKISVASSHLLSLINEVLDMSRINSGRMMINEELTSLSDLLHETMTIITPQSEAKHHELKLDIHDIIYENIYVDATRLRQIYVNIINNAIKYTNPFGKISLSFYEESLDEKLWLNFICKDNGIGMSEEFLERIFTPFERAISSTISKIEGTGLGMSIVKKLVESMEGTITIQSELEKGTTVEIRLPVRYELIDLNTDALRNKKLLVLEEEPVIQKNYRLYFDEMELEYTIVTSSSDAINLLSESAYGNEPYSALLIGSRYESNGTFYELASYVKKAIPNTVVILISSDNWEEIEYRATRSGIDSFIPLPFFRKSLINALNDALSVQNNSPEEHSVIDLSGKRILLVEDNMINMMIAKELLKPTEAELFSAENGQDAVDQYLLQEDGFYDLILMDIQMPVLDGYNATKMIRSSKRNDARTVKIYAMSANTFAEDIAKAKEAGMDGHIAKPIDVKKLMSTLRKAF